MNSNLSKILLSAGLALLCVAAQASTVTTSGMGVKEGSAGLIAQGNERWSAGKLDDAQQAFEQAVRIDPGSVEVHMKLGGLQLARNDFSHSIQTYQRVIGLDPNNSKAWIALGISYLHTGKNELSLAAFGVAVKLDPNRQAQLAPVIAKLNTPE
ncbi:MAG: tetratricopeptide repeat protein [Nitrosomonadales bacterium]|nr:tetratricopeptide repeat protein [Nitrosomonadales bacterium]